MVALSLMALAGIVTAGLSASLVTLVGRASASADRHLTNQLVTAASLVAALWSLPVFAIMVPAALFINWASLLGVAETFTSHDIGMLVAMLFALLGVGFLASIPRQVMIGNLHGYVAHIVDSVGVISGMVGLVVALNVEAPLWVLGMAFAAPPIAVSFACGMIYLKSIGLSLFSRSAFDRQTIQNVGTDSFKMMGYQGAYAVSSQSDLILIGIVLGAPASAVYGLAQRIFSLPIMAALAVNQAQWPVMAKLDAAGEHEQISRMFTTTVISCTVTATVGAIALAMFYAPLTTLWLGKAVVTDHVVLSGMVAWVAVGTLTNTLDSVLRAKHETTYLMRSMAVMAVLNILATLLLLPALGPGGAIWGSVTGFVLALAIPYSVRLRALFAAVDSTTKVITR